MFKIRGRVCGNTLTKKNGVRKGVQLYKCQNCGYQFRSGFQVSDDELWTAYQQQKQTIKELSLRFKISISTVKRRLHDIKCEWVQPPLNGGGFVHLDVTYWGAKLRSVACIGHGEWKASLSILCKERDGEGL